MYCNPDYTNELSLISECTYSTTTASGTPIEYIYYHIPFFIYIILLIPFIWIANRFFIEMLIRWRSKK